MSPAFGDAEFFYYIDERHGVEVGGVDDARPTHLALEPLLAYLPDLTYQDAFRSGPLRRLCDDKILWGSLIWNAYAKLPASDPLYKADPHRGTWLEDYPASQREHLAAMRRAAWDAHIWVKSRLFHNRLEELAQGLRIKISKDFASQLALDKVAWDLHYAGVVPTPVDRSTWAPLTARAISSINLITGNSRGFCDRAGLLEDLSVVRERGCTYPFQFVDWYTTGADQLVCGLDSWSRYRDIQANMARSGKGCYP